MHFISGHRVAVGMGMWGENCAPARRIGICGRPAGFYASSFIGLRLEGQLWENKTCLREDFVLRGILWQELPTCSAGGVLGILDRMVAVAGGVWSR